MAVQKIFYVQVKCSWFIQPNLDTSLEKSADNPSSPPLQTSEWDSEHQFCAPLFLFSIVGKHLLTLLSRQTKVPQCSDGNSQFL